MGCGYGFDGLDDSSGGNGFGCGGSWVPCYGVVGAWGVSVV